MMENILGILFEGPFLLKIVQLPPKQGIYIIMRKSDNKYLYIGESENLANRVNEYHEKYECWKNHVESENDLYVYYHVLPDDADERLRKNIENVLIMNYNPICNK